MKRSANSWKEVLTKCWAVGVKHQQHGNQTKTNCQCRPILPPAWYMVQLLLFLALDLFIFAMH